MKRIAFAMFGTAISAVSPFSSAHAQLFPAQCQPETEFIQTYRDDPGTTGEIVGERVVYCDGHVVMIGRFSPYVHVQNCNQC